METTARRPGRQRDASRQAAILDATRQVLVECGFEGLTIDAVARRAGASRSTIYRWWTSPTDLVVSALGARLEVEVPVPDTGTLAGDLVAMLTRHAQVEGEERAAIFAGLVHAMKVDPALREVVMGQLVDRQQERVNAAVLERARARGEVGAGATPELLGEVLTAMVSMRTMIMAQPFDDAWIAHAVHDVVVPVLHAAG